MNSSNLSQDLGVMLFTLDLKFSHIKIRHSHTKFAHNASYVFLVILIFMDFIRQPLNIGDAVVI